MPFKAFKKKVDENGIEQPSAIEILLSNTEDLSGSGRKFSSAFKFGGKLKGDKSLQQTAFGNEAGKAAKNPTNVRAVDFRPGPSVKDPGGNISRKELAAEEGRLLVEDRIKNQGILIGQQQVKLGRNLSELERHLVFRKDSGVSKKQILKAGGDAQIIKLIREGLESRDRQILKATSRSNELNAGLGRRAAESLAGFQFAQDAAEENEPLLRRVQMQALGRSALLRTSGAGVPVNPATNALSAGRVGGRVNQLGNPIGNQQTARGNMFSGPKGLIENNILGTRQEV